MKQENIDRIIKSFGMSNLLAENDLDRIEDEFGIDLGRRQRTLNEVEDKYYPQFEHSLRLEAATMAKRYELFYCLERSIRELVSDALEAVAGEQWWDTGVVPPKIKDEVAARIQKEKDSGFTKRSQNHLDYTTFGELGEIIRFNAAAFAGVLNNLKAVDRVMFNLNTLRNPIAHCTPLADDEVLRLELSLRDWFRLLA